MPNSVCPSRPARTQNPAGRWNSELLGTDVKQSRMLCVYHRPGPLLRPGKGSERQCVPRQAGGLVCPDRPKPWGHQRGACQKQDTERGRPPPGKCLRGPGHQVPCRTPGNPSQQTDNHPPSLRPAETCGRAPTQGRGDAENLARVRGSAVWTETTLPGATWVWVSLPSACLHFTTTVPFLVFILRECRRRSTKIYVQGLLYL